MKPVMIGGGDISKKYIRSSRINIPSPTQFDRMNFASTEGKKFLQTDVIPILNKLTLQGNSIQAMQQNGNRNQADQLDQAVADLAILYNHSLQLQFEGVPFINDRQ